MLFIVLWVLMGLLAAAIASGKGHSFGLWLIVGFFFGIFAVIIAIFLPKVKPQQVVLAEGAPALPPRLSKSERLEEARDMHQSGEISDDEYEDMRRRILATD